MKHYLGIDGGGTKTTAVVADENNNILCRAEGKTINFYAAGMEKSRENLKEIMLKIKNATGISSFYSAFIGCSALDCVADSKTVNALCGNIISSDTIGMDSDVYTALTASDGNCIAICGTGSVTAGYNSDGRLIVKGGWGHILGDEGSAYSIALSALKKCCMLDDKHTDSSLLNMAKEYFKVNNFREIIDVVYSDTVNKDYIAGFASRVSALAENGDFSSSAIIKNEALAFSGTVKTLIAGLDVSPHLSLYGGVLKNNALFTETFCAELENSFDNITISILETPAEEGALKVAMKQR